MLHMSPRVRVISAAPALDIIPSVESTATPPPAASSTTVTKTLMPSERQYHAPMTPTHSYDLVHHRSSVVRVLEGSDGKSTAL